jgi:acetyl-CoA acyltransferase
LAEVWWLNTLGKSANEYPQYQQQHTKRSAEAADKPYPGIFPGMLPIVGSPDDVVEGLAKLKPSFKEDGKVTAANSSQITDGASAALIMSEQKANELGLRPRARFHAFAVSGVDPIMMLTGPIPATEKVLERAGMTMDDIDLFEVNEAFASVIGAWQKEHNADMSKVNVNGGAIALGHPLGGSGAKLMATLLNELERTGGRYGLQTMCEGGGQANVTILERL